MLLDRVQKIQSINEQYNLLDNAYLSFSGGKDSLCLHYLLDLALPGNKIPRLFLNTGLEYLELLNFVKEMAKNDDRIVVLNNTLNIKKTLDTFGYPFKSKYFSHVIKQFNDGVSMESVNKFLNGQYMLKCPKDLKYIFERKNVLPFKVSDLCCYKFKKEPAKKWAKLNNKSIILTGMRKDEGGQRALANCIVTDKDGNLKKFHPLLVVDEEFENKFFEKYDIKLCKLYYEPYNFKRTGCKGCPFALQLQNDLYTMNQLMPNERKQCEFLWKPVYDEYRRINYHLSNNYSIFDS